MCANVARAAKLTFYDGLIWGGDGIVLRPCYEQRPAAVNKILWTCDAKVLA